MKLLGQARNWRFLIIPTNCKRSSPSPHPHPLRPPAMPAPTPMSAMQRPRPEDSGMVCSRRFNTAIKNPYQFYIL